ncbi:CAP domain-containing protein [Immersiella caudata]|uniref:CAP domain-containing protein n=1 Tax=Immersiella caudata TaxID=314043 RepID=A0AA39XI15_9PEZI|nr:CAP domain-containing protein [Immersiella caudata]
MRSSILLAASSAILAVASPVLQERGRTIVETETATEWVVVTVTDGIPLPSMFRPDRNRVFPSSITSFSSASPTPTPEPSPEPAPAPAPEPEPAPFVPEVPDFVPEPPAFVESPPPPPPAPAPPAPAPVQQAPAGDDYVSTALYHHNVHRSNHSSGDLSWGSSYADYALQTAKRCKFEHDLSPGGGGYGQNLAMYATSSGAQAFGANRAAAQAASNFWYNGELNKFPSNGYGSPTPDMGNFHGWGHFSQLVWTNTQQVGCASYLCPAGTMVSGMDAWFTVCNYFPAGNVAGAYANNVKAPSGHPTVQAS